MDEVVKRCSKCGEAKSVELFSFRSRGDKRLHARCKACMTIGWKAWYSVPENRARHINHNRGTNKRQIERDREYVIDHLRSHSCVDCGNDDIRVLEFDRVRGEKSSNVSALWSNG